MTISLDNFGGALTAWTKAIEAQFKLYYPLKGGWEAWVQASVAAFIISHDNTVDILREQAIFELRGQRVDWLLNDSDRLVTNKIAIELKCQSFENRRAFTIGLDQDVAKLDQDNISPAYKGCQTAVVGICFEGAALQWMQTNQFVILHQTGETACGFRRVH